MEDKKFECSLCKETSLLADSCVINKEEIYNPGFLTVRKKWIETKGRCLQASEDMRLINMIQNRIVPFRVHKPVCESCAKEVKRILGHRSTIPLSKAPTIEIRVYSVQGVKRHAGLRLERRAESLLAVAGITSQ